MIRRILAVSVGVAALAVLAAPTPSEAARKVMSAEAHGFNQESVSKVVGALEPAGCCPGWAHHDRLQHDRPPR